MINSPYKIPKKLLSKGNTNSKTAKNNLESYILYLSPAKQNNKSINLCPKASKGCLAACLYTAGRGKFSNVKTARINKANYYINDKINFIDQLTKAEVFDDPIVTEVTEFDKFYKAEDYHQNYYNDNKTQGYCMAVINPKLNKFLKEYKSKLK